MEFHSEAHRQCYEKVAKWMVEIFGEQAMASKDWPKIGLYIGSAITEVYVFPWGDNDAIISSYSFVVTGAELTPDLMRFLLEENERWHFGAFSIDQEGNINYSHNIVGSTCDKEELRASVIAVARLSDDYDDKIVARYGGQRAADR
jgi:hypothetical protein